VVKRFKEFIKNERKLLIVITGIIVCFVFSYVFIFKKPYILSNDQWFQYNQFYKEYLSLIRDFLKGNGFPMYSWNTYLGTDFFSAMGTICTGDIFIPILFLFRNNVEIGLIIEIILCIYIGAILMDILLQKLEVKNESIRLLIAITYVFGGQAVIYFDNYMFYRFLTFLPLLFIGLLNYFQSNKRKLFIISVAILFMQSYYFMYPTLIVLFIICLFEEIRKRNNIRLIFKDFVMLLYSLTIGFLISAFVCVPAIIYILNNSRVGTGDSGIFWDNNVYYGLIMTLTSMNPIDTGWDIFNTTNEVHDNWYNLYIGVIPFVYSIKYLFKKDNRFELICFTLLTIIMFLKPLCSIMHGFSEASLRWVFLYEFYLLILSAKALDNLDSKHILLIYIIYSVLCTILLISGIKTTWIDVNVCYKHFYYLLAYFIVNIIVLIIYYKKPIIAIYLSICLVVISLLWYQGLHSKDSLVLPDNKEREVISFYDNDENDLIHRYHLNYDDFIPNSELNQNRAIDFGVMSTSGYLTAYDPELDKFIGLSKSRVTVDWNLSCDNVYVNTALGVKYYITSSEEKLPENLNYKYVYAINYLKVYENLDYKGFGHTYENIKYTDDFIDDNDFVNYVLVDDKNVDISKYNNLHYEKLNVTYKNNNQLVGDISLNEPNILVIPIANNSGWKIEVNGETIKPISVMGGLIGIQLNEGYSKINMEFVTPGIIPGVCMSICGIIILTLISIKEKKV